MNARMIPVINFDDLKRMRDEAARRGVGSKAFVDFCQTFYDKFPDIYATARRLTENARNLGECPPRIRETLKARGWTETKDYRWTYEYLVLADSQPKTWEDAILLELYGKEAAENADDY